MSLHTRIRGGHQDAVIKWYLDYFSQLKDATITEVRFEQPEPEPDEDYPDEYGFSDDEEYWPVFVVRLANGELREISVSQDEEGNGPGWVFGLDYPPPPATA